MARTPGRKTTATAVLLTALATAAITQAGTGSAVSAPASIDTRLPVVTVADPPPNTLLQTGQTIDLSWTAGDDNPNAAPDANVAEIRLDGQVLAAQPFNLDSGPFNWQWVIPDTTGYVHLEVRATDTFGNQTTVAAAAFTILSGVTDVPDRSLLPVFAQPAPNPFNPQTRLRFNLPSGGPVRVTVHDARGYLVGTLYNAQRQAGPLVLNWDGTNAAGQRQAGGTYFFRLTYRDGGQQQQAVRKAVLLP